MFYLHLSIVLFTIELFYQDRENTHHYGTITGHDLTTAERRVTAAD
jgi:hypothetical protein